jgi:hypothetical protein
VLVFGALQADMDEVSCSSAIGFLIVSSPLVIEHFEVFPFYAMIFVLLLDFKQILTAHNNLLVLLYPKAHKNHMLSFCRKKLGVQPPTRFGGAAFSSQDAKNKNKSNKNKPITMDAQLWIKRRRNSLAAAALGGEPQREPVPILAVVVAHVVALRPPDAAPLGGVELPVHPPVPAGVARAAADAGVGVEAPVGDDEGRVVPVDGDLALLRGPVAAVPQRGVQRHGLGARVGEIGVALEGADEHVIHLEEDVLRVPDDGVGVVVGRGVEPQVELVLLLAVAVGPHVGVEHHRLAAGVAHELHVDLVAPVVSAGRKLQLIVGKSAKVLLLSRERES